jgi:hypothetical protein
MPSVRRHADDDILPVMVPRNTKPLVPNSAARGQKLRTHVANALREARHLKMMASPYPPEPTGFAARVARTACALCKGWCCRNGGDDAFLDDQTMARVRRDRPDLDEQTMVNLYAEQVPDLAYKDSCIFHGMRGCTLDRALRADICNSYFCGGLSTYLTDRRAAASTVVIAGKGIELRTSPVLAPRG